jgi:hypothetical protein
VIALVVADFPGQHPQGAGLFIEIPSTTHRDLPI